MMDSPGAAGGPETPTSASITIVLHPDTPDAGLRAAGRYHGCQAVRAEYLVPETTAPARNPEDG